MDTGYEKELRDKKEDKKDDVKKYIEANNLEYLMPENANLIEQRAMVRNSFNKSSYTVGDDGVLMFNTSDMYVNGRTSYFSFGLSFNLTAEDYADQLITFGKGSAFNVIKTIAIVNQQGQEMDRLSNKNLIRKLLDDYECDSDFFNSVGSAMGYPKKAVTATGYVVELAQAASYSSAASYAVSGKVARTWAIPLSKLSGLFDVPILMPNFLASGLRVEITWEDASNAFLFAGADLDTKTKVEALGYNSYTISNPVFMLDSYSLSSSVAAIMNRLSAEKGLYYVYNSWDNNQTNITSAINVNCKRAVTKAVKTIAIRRLDSVINNYVADTMKAAPWIPGTSWQYQLGGIFLPRNVVSNDTDSYKMAQYAFDKYGNYNTNSANYDGFLSVRTESVAATPGDGSTTFGFYNPGQGIMAMNLEKSPELKLSGLKISSGRVLQLVGTVPAGAAATLNLFTEFTQIAQIFNNKVVLSN